MSRELRMIITQNCNYECYFCHREGIDRNCDSKFNSSDYEYLFSVCKEKYGWNEVSLTGGEPLMNKEVNNIIEKLYNRNGKITIITNGELLLEHEKIIPYIKRINLSLHSLDKEKYEQIINRKDKMEKILRNIAYIRNKYPNVDLRLNVVLTKGVNNTEKNIMELLNFTEKIGGSIKFIELYTRKKEDIVKLEFVEEILLKNNYKYYESSNVSKKYMTNGKTDVVMSRIFCANAEKHFEPAYYCNKYNDLFVTPDGYVNICREKNDEISILNEVKKRDKEGLIRKMDEALNSIGKKCIFSKEEKKLAINGGEKIFKDDKEGKYIHPRITKEIENAVIEQLYDTISIYDNSNIFQKFEDEFAEYHNKKYGLVTSSGTAALWSMYDAIGLKSNDEILCPAYTFFATNTPIFLTGATPVLVDCDEYGNMNVNEIENKITSRTKAIVVTHMWGYPCQMDKIRDIADKYHLYLLEDCSHAHGGSYKGKKLGEWGDVAAFSLQGNKIITGGEGGILITNDKNIYDRAILLGHYNKRCKKEIDKDSPIYKYAVTGKGMKLRAHPLAIRIAYEQFKDLDDINSQKQEYAKIIIEQLKDIKGLEVIEPMKDATNSWYALIIKYHPEYMNNVSREKFVDAVIAEGGVEIDIPNSTCPVNYLELFKYPDFLYDNYRNKIRYSEEDFSNATKFYNEIIKLPVWEYKDDEEIVYKYIRAIKKVANNIDEL